MNCVNTHFISSLTYCYVNYLSTWSFIAISVELGEGDRVQYTVLTRKICVLFFGGGAVTKNRTARFIRDSISNATPQATSYFVTSPLAV
jgi:hypothetical protein